MRWRFRFKRKKKPMRNSTSDYFSKLKNLRSASSSFYLLPTNGMYSPKRSTVNNILAYSRALEVKSSESGKKVSVILN